MQQKAVGDMRTRQSDTGQEQLAPKVRQSADLIHERPMEITPGREQSPARSRVPKERPTQTIPSKEQSIIPPQTIKGRMQQAAIKKGRTKQRERQQEPFLLRDRAASPPFPDILSLALTGITTNRPSANQLLETVEIRQGLD